MSPAATRGYILAFGIAITALYLWALSGWGTYSHEGTLGAQYGPLQANLELPIVRLAPGSPLAAAGAQVGDRIRFDHARDGHRYVGTGEVLGLSIVSGATAHHAEVTAGPAPPGFFTSGFGAILTAFVSVLALAIGMVVGLRRADHPSILFFAMAILLQPLNYANRRIPPGAIADLLDAMNPLVPYCAMFTFFAFFCLTFPDTAMGPWRRRLRNLLVPLAVIGSAVGLWGTGNAIGWIVTPWTRPYEIYSITCVTLSLTGLALARHEATGVMRTRIAWILASMGLVYLSYLWSNMLVLLGLTAWAQPTQWASAGAIAAGYFGLTYALLRHRLFDIGFVVNRALVYGLISASMLLSFGLLEWLVHKVVHFEEQRQNAFLDAGIALVVFLAFNKIHHLAGHAVEAVFFRSWRRRDEDLRAFVARAAHLSAREELLRELDAALARYTGDAPRAIMLREADGGFRDAPRGRALHPDDPLAVAVREGRAPLVPDGFLARPDIELVLPMGHRRAPSGVVMLGARPGVGSYRPDEVELLGHAAHQVGLDLHALDVEELRAALAQARDEIARAHVEIEALRAARLPLA